MYKYLYILSSVILLFTCCEKDFVVKDISKKTMIVNAPADGTVSESNLITFWWESLDGAESYDLQVVQPDFATTTKLVADTAVTGTLINLSLQPGDYEWRIRAVNAGYKTAFKTFRLKIDTTQDLSKLTVNLRGPSNGDVSSSVNVTFFWDELPLATDYRLLIDAGLTLDTTLINNSVNLDLPAVSNSVTTYRWDVQARNSGGKTALHALPFTYTIDRKPPTAPVLTSPQHGFTVKDTVLLSWNRTGGADVAYDSIYLATDSTFTNIISQDRIIVTKIRVNELTNAPAPNSAGFYWWRVCSFDKVDNGSATSGGMKFKLVQ